MEPLADIVYAACSNPTKLLKGHPTPDGLRRLGMNIKTALRESRRYYIDDEVVRAATHLGVQHPDVLMSMLRRARLPFNKCWVEWSPRAQVEESGYIPAEDIPERTGCILERLDQAHPLFRMTMIGFQPDGERRLKSCCVAPISIIYNLEQPISLASSDRHSIAEISKLPQDYINKTLIGGAYMEHSLYQREPDEIEHRRRICDELASYATHSILPFIKPFIQESLSSYKYNVNWRQEWERVFRSEIIEHSGSWRFIISLFALINSRDYLESDKVLRHGKSRSVNAKMIPYLDHFLVALKLPRKIVQQRALREYAEAIPRRRHEVEGHWKQSRKKGLLGCEHVYVDETPTRQVCVFEGCGHKRWWVNEFERGDASIGYVIKDRLVVKD